MGSERCCTPCKVGGSGCCCELASVGRAIVVDDGGIVDVKPKKKLFNFKKKPQEEEIDDWDF